MSQKKKWSELSPSAKAGLIAAALVELVITTTAMRDLSRRSRDQVRGPKWLWRLVSIIQPVGPIAYQALGRRKK
ncbi:MAG: PLDc N-terminal domain-containing protein [Actinomycetota bacterium]|nr:PLDc N-terminal domain-containing protein [Actinomycetota bacterium]